MADMQPRPAGDSRDVIGALVAAWWPLEAVAVRALAAVEPELTVAQYRVLVLLGARGTGGVAAMAAFTRRDPRAVRCLVEWLCAVGLVEQAAARGGGGELRWRLSVAGRRVVYQVDDYLRRELARVVQRIPLEQRGYLAAGLRAIISAGGALSADMPGLFD